MIKAEQAQSCLIVQSCDEARRAVTVLEIMHILSLIHTVHTGLLLKCIVPDMSHTRVTNKKVEHVI